MGYTLCFIQRHDEILLLNRVKSPNLGLWNGVGGKIDTGETPLACVIREVFEETGITLSKSQFINLCLVKWDSEDHSPGLMYVYLASVPDDFAFAAPVLREEGILAWKRIDWILHKDNEGIAQTIPYFLPSLMNSKQPLCHTFYFPSEDVFALRHEVTNWTY